MKQINMEKLRSAHLKQAEAIRKTPEYAEISAEFELEYAIANELVKARRNASLTQSQIASLMGTTQSVVSRIERGANVSIETIARYAHACGKNLELHLV